MRWGLVVIGDCLFMARETDSASRRATLWAWWAERWVGEGAVERVVVLLDWRWVG